jgi:hypothetical protein
MNPCPYRHLVQGFRRLSELTCKPDDLPEIDNRVLRLLEGKIVNVYVAGDSLVAAKFHTEDHRIAFVIR